MILSSTRMAMATLTAQMAMIIAMLMATAATVKPLKQEQEGVLVLLRVRDDLASILPAAGGTTIITDAVDTVTQQAMPEQQEQSQEWVRAHTGRQLLPDPLLAGERRKATSFSKFLLSMAAIFLRCLPTAQLQRQLPGSSILGRTTSRATIAIGMQMRIQDQGRHTRRRHRRRAGCSACTVQRHHTRCSCSCDDCFALHAACPGAMRAPTVYTLGFMMTMTMMLRRTAHERSCPPLLQPRLI